MSQHSAPDTARPAPTSDPTAGPVLTGARRADGGPLRFALVGCGVIARTHARALVELAGRAELVACSDVDPDRALELAAEFGLKAMDLHDVLADPDIDAITICTPSGRHAEVGVPALLAGKHVIVEKPMEITVEACDRLLEAQARSGAVLAVVSQHRFDPASRLVKDAVDDGTLGRLVLVDCRVPWYRTQEYYDSGDWRGTWDMDGGGALMNQGVHTVDLLLWTCGPVRRVSAQARTATHERIEVEDVVCATIELANGAIGTIVASTSAYPGFPARLAVHGTAGGAVIEGDRLATLATVDGRVVVGEAATADALQVATGGTRAATRGVDDAASNAVAATDPTEWGRAHRDQLLDFVEAVENGRPPLLDGRQGKEAVALVRAVYESARTGLPVTL